MKTKSKKGEMFWYVVGAILAVLVLVLSIFFYDKGFSSAKNDITLLKSCKIIGGGTCEPNSCKPGYDQIDDYGCSDKTQKCCIPRDNKQNGK